MANYRIPKEVASELKMNKFLYLFDFLFLVGLAVLTMIFNNFVHSDLKIIYFIFMSLVGIIMVWRPHTNPKKRMYEVLLITLMRRRSTYCAIDRDQN